MPAKKQSESSLDAQSRSYLEALLGTGVGSFSLTGILTYHKSFGKAHLFHCGLIEVTLFGRSGDYAVGHFVDQLCELTGRIETREHNGRRYPQFVATSCWPVRV